MLEVNSRWAALQAIEEVNRALADGTFRKVRGRSVMTELAEAGMYYVAGAQPPQISSLTISLGCHHAQIMFAQCSDCIARHVAYGMPCSESWARGRSSCCAVRNISRVGHISGRSPVSCAPCREVPPAVPGQGWELGLATERREGRIRQDQVLRLREARRCRSGCAALPGCFAACLYACSVVLPAAWFGRLGPIKDEQLQARCAP